MNREESYQWLEKQPGYVGHFPAESISILAVICTSKMTKEIRDSIVKEFGVAEFRVLKDEEIK